METQINNRIPDTISKKVMAVEQKALQQKIKTVSIIGAVSLIAVLGLLMMSTGITYIVVAAITIYLLYEYQKAQQKIVYLETRYGV